MLDSGASEPNTHSLEWGECGLRHDNARQPRSMLAKGLCRHANGPRISCRRRPCAPARCSSASTMTTVHGKQLRDKLGAPNAELSCSQRRGARQGRRLGRLDFVFGGFRTIADDGGRISTARTFGGARPPNSGLRANEENYCNHPGRSPVTGNLPFHAGSGSTSCGRRRGDDRIRPGGPSATGRHDKRRVRNW